MQIGLAAWHYGHRTLVENIEFFLSHGFDYVSLLGDWFYEGICDEQTSCDIVKALGDTKCTVHFSLPRTHSQNHVDYYKKAIQKIGEWQAKYGLIDVLSFDVHQETRDCIKPYIDYAVENVPNTKLALEDFGLNDHELGDILHLKDNKNFGYLLDIGHMYIRFCGVNDEGKSLFTQSKFEANEPSADGFYKTFCDKHFPIFEIHLHNNDGKNDLHNFLDDGTLNIKNVVDALKKFGFDGRLTIESAPGYTFDCYGDDADNGIFKTRDYLLNML